MQDWIEMARVQLIDHEKGYALNVGISSKGMVLMVSTRIGEQNMRTSCRTKMRGR